MRFVPLLAASGLLVFALAPAQAQPPTDAVVCKGESRPEPHGGQRLAACQRLAAAAPDPIAQAKAQVDVAGVARQLGRYVEAQVAAEAAIRLDPKSAGALVALARIRGDLSEDDAAMAGLDAALKLDPKSAAAHFARGRLWQHNLHDPAKARAEYATALTLDPTLAGVRYQQILLDEDADPQTALTVADAAIRDFPDKIYLQRERGAVLEALGRPQDALGLYDALLRAHPDEEGAYRYRARLRFSRGDKGGAMADADRAIRVDDDLGQPYLTKGYLLEMQGQNKPALEVYKAALARAPNEPSIFVALARTERALGNTDLALAQAEAGLKFAPNDSDLLAERARAWSDKSEPAKAVADYDRVIRRSPTAAAYFNRGSQLSNAGEHARALADFRKAMELDPKDPDMPDMAGGELATLKQDDEALKMFNAALALKPDHANALVGRGELQARRSEWAKAAQDYEQALKADPARTGVIVALGEIWSELGFKDKALQAYDRAVRAKAGVGRAWTDRGELLSAQGHNRDALAAFNAAVAAEPANVDALVDRAAILRDAKDYAGARRDLDAALKAKPDSPDVLNARGLTEWYAGENAAAIGAFDRVIAANASYASAYYNRALVFVDDGRRDRAIRDLDVYMTLAPDDLDGPQLKADIYRKLQDHMLAVELYDQVIRRDPKRAQAWWRRGLSREAMGDASGAAADKAAARRLDPKIS